MRRPRVRTKAEDEQFAQAMQGVELKLDHGLDKTLGVLANSNLLDTAAI